MALASDNPDGGYTIMDCSLHVKPADVYERVNPASSEYPYHAYIVDNSAEGIADKQVMAIADVLKDKLEMAGYACGEPHYDATANHMRIGFDPHLERKDELFPSIEAEFNDICRQAEETISRDGLKTSVVNTILTGRRRQEVGERLYDILWRMLPAETPGRIDLVADITSQIMEEYKLIPNETMRTR